MPKRKLPRLLMRRDGPDCVPEMPLEFGYLFRTYRPGDHEIWCEVTHGHTYDGWTPARFRRSVLQSRRFDPSGLLFVTFCSRAAGTALAWRDRPRSKTGRLRLLVVREGYRRRGIGAFLASKALEYFRAHGFQTCEIEVDPSRLAGIRTCLKLGFRPAPRTPSEERQWRTLLSKHGLEPL